MNLDTPLTDADFHAYVDGQLSLARRKIVEDYLSINPEALQRVTNYQQQNELLHSYFDPILEQTVDKSLLPRRTNRKIWRIAASISWLVVGIFIGWSINGSNSQTTQALASVNNNLVSPAVFAHTVFATDPVRPVEIKALHEKKLIKWLSKRLHTKLQAPNLLDNGFELIGGRLLPSTNRMAAQFMYRNRNNKRITLYIRRISGVDSEPMFQYDQNKNISTFYWIDSSLGYALSGNINKSQLLSLSNTIYSHLYDF